MPILEPVLVSRGALCLDLVRILGWVPQEAHSETVCVPEAYWRAPANQHLSGSEGNGIGQRKGLNKKLSQFHGEL